MDGISYVLLIILIMNLNTWKVVHTPKIYGGLRDSKKPKILPHRYLKDYDISVWVDGDVKITSDINKLVDDYLSDKDYFCF